MRWIITLSVLVSLCFLNTKPAPAGDTRDFLRPRQDIPEWNQEGSDSVLIERRSYGGYVFESRGVYKHAHYTISRNGKVLFTSKESPEYFHHYRAGHRTYAGVFTPKPDSPLTPIIPMGTDITGNGVPNLVVTHLHGGNSGIWHIDIFEIGEQFRHIHQISEYYGDLSDINGNGAMELVFGACGFAYLPVYTGGGNAFIPYPEVVFSYQGDGYKFDPELMREPAPGSDELKEIANEILETWPDEGVQLGSSEHSAPLRFVSWVIDFIYEGNIAAAHYLEQNAVPAHARHGVMTEILPHIYEQIEASCHAAALRNMNGVAVLQPSL